MTDGKSVRRLTSILSKPNPQRFIWFSWGWTVPQNQSIIKGLTGFYWVSLGFHWVLGLWQMLSVEDPGGGGCSMKEANGGFLLAIAAGSPPLLPAIRHIKTRLHCIVGVPASHSFSSAPFEATYLLFSYRCEGSGWRNRNAGEPEKNHKKDQQYTMKPSLSIS